MAGPMRAISLSILAVSLAAPASAREWADKTGAYTIEAELIGFDDEHVILQREDKELGTMPIAQLSDADQEFLKTKEASEIHDANIGKMQTWSTQGGLKVVGRIVDFARGKITIQKRRGKTYVNDTVYENLPAVYRQMMPRIVSFFENRTIEDDKALDNWVQSLAGRAVTYELEGVKFELENGDEYGVPFFVFSLEDQEVLKPGWKAWLEAQGDTESSEDESFRLQSLAAAYHQNQKVNQQIAMMNLNMQAIQAGLTTAWEVTLYPGPGNPSPPRWVVTLGRNSLIATEAALQQNPGFYAGPVRRVSGR